MAKVNGLVCLKLEGRGEDIPEVRDKGPVWAVVIQIDGITTAGAKM